MSQITYPSNKYTSTFPSKVTTNLYDMAQEYKKKNSDFDKSLVFDEKITKTRQQPSNSVVKDIFSATGKFFSRKVLLYDTTTINFSELQSIFKVKDKFLGFESKRTIEFLNMIYSKLKLDIRASQDLVGKKINLYFPKETNSSWFIRKYISIESSSAPIELVEVGDIVQNEVSNYNSYNVELNNMAENGTKDVSVNGGKVRVKKVNGDVSTWIKSSYTKSTQNSESKKIGWGKIIVDLPIYNTTIIDVYKESIASPDPASIVEVAFPIYTTIEDMLTNKSLYEKYNTILFDNVNFFNTALLSLLKNIPAEDTSVLKKLGNLGEAGENKSGKKIVGKLSRVMGLYLGLKKAYVGILRKIRQLFDAFSIKDLNKLLNAINSFNNKRNYITKKKSKTDLNGNKTFYTETEFLNLSIIKDYVIQKNWTLVTSEFNNNDIKWGINKTFNLVSESEISAAVKALTVFYNENRTLDPLNYFSTLAPDIIAREIVADLTNVKLESVNKEILEFDKVGREIWLKSLVEVKKILPSSETNLTKLVKNNYDLYTKDLILKMARFISNILKAYLIKADPDAPINEEGLVDFIKGNVGELYWDGYIDMGKKIVYKLITENEFGYVVDMDKLNEVLDKVTYENLTEETRIDIGNLGSHRSKNENIRKIYLENVAKFIALIGNLEKWAFKTTNYSKIDLTVFNVKNIGEIMKTLSNATKITFIQKVYDALEDFNKYYTSKSTMDLQFSNALAVSDIVCYLLEKGLDSVIDVEALKSRKLEEREDNVPQNESSMIIDRMEINEEVSNQLLVNNIVNNFEEAREEMNINEANNENLNLQENNNEIALTEIKNAVNTGVSSESTSVTTFKKDKKDKKDKSVMKVEKGGTMKVENNPINLQGGRITRSQNINLDTESKARDFLSKPRKNK